MKRFHIHVAVDDLPTSISFYSMLFGQSPSKQKQDYAKIEKHWTIDPQVLTWEHCFTLSDAVTFGEDTAMQTGVCCIPMRSSDRSAYAERKPCCISQEAMQDQEQCCS